MPVVNAPFRVYWAYNPWTCEENLQPPMVADRSYFPNAATFVNAVAQVGQSRAVLRAAHDVPFHRRANVLALRMEEYRCRS